MIHFSKYKNRILVSMLVFLSAYYHYNLSIIFVVICLLIIHVSKYLLILTLYNNLTDYYIFRFI